MPINCGHDILALLYLCICDMVMMGASRLITNRESLIISV
jgi:hypothetical protein